MAPIIVITDDASHLAILPEPRISPSAIPHKPDTIMDDWMKEPPTPWPNAEIALREQKFPTLYKPPTFKPGMHVCLKWKDGNALYAFEKSPPALARLYKYRQIHTSIKMSIDPHE